jgi:filamentous hemagglutinin
MNRNCYRLVFNPTLGMMTPVAETARRRGKAAGAALLAGALFAGMGGLEPAYAIDAGTVPTGGIPTAAGVVIQAPVAIPGGNRLTIDQSVQKAIINWQGFSIGSASEVVFNQQLGASSATLNRVTGIDPSVLAGRMTAPGQIYLVNPNGIVFANGAQIDVGSLTASTLSLTDPLFRDGVLAVPSTSTINAEPVAAFTNEGGSSGGIVVEMGALIKAAEHGQVALYAPTVENAGRIETPDGQAVLAAGEKVYLRSSDDINVRGLLVEVGTGGVVTNSGQIVSERGNVTLVGMAVNQNGRITATTSGVNANGTISLYARDTPLVKTSEGKYIATRAGAVTLGKDSVTEVLPELDSTASITDNVAFTPSRIDIMGKTVEHQGKIVAHGGEVRILGASDPSKVLMVDSFSAFATQTTRDPGVRVHLADGSLIDVSGTQEVVLPMSSRQLEVELRGDELKDRPYQRDGVLKGKKVTIDLGRGTEVADVSGLIAAVPKTLAEKTLAGGTVDIRSQGDVVMDRRAAIDVSGGQVRYESGVLDVTRLTSNGRVYDIADAPADVIYDGVLDPAPRFVEGFTEGRDAGTVKIIGHGLVLDGELSGHATAGVNQRATPPRGGELILSDFSTVSNNVGNASGGDRSHDVVFTAERTQSTSAVGVPVMDPLKLSTDFIARGGFTRVDIQRHGAIEQPVDIALAPGGRFRLAGETLTVSGDLIAPAGTIDLSTVQVLGKPAGDLTVVPGTRLSTRGLWVNDTPGLAGAGRGVTQVNGGDISLAAVGDLLLGRVNGNQLDLAYLDVGGGGWLQAGGKLVKGNGGNLALSGKTIRLGAAIQALSPGAGGTLTLDVQDSIVIRDGEATQTNGGIALAAADVAAAEGLVLPAWIFRDWGFSGFDITTQAGSASVAPGTQLELVASSLGLGTAHVSAVSGSDPMALGERIALPWARKPASFTLTQQSNSRADVLSVGTGARITADPGASIRLSSNNAVFVDGEVSAPGGLIDLAIKGPFPAPSGTFIDSQAIWLGEHARLSAAGVYQSTPHPDGLRQGTVWGGGDIVLRADRGFVYAASGSVIDVSGTQATLDVETTRGIETRQVASDAGSISVTAAEGLYLDGMLRGNAGGEGAAGGSLEVRMSDKKRAASNALDSTGFTYTARELLVRDRGGSMAPGYLVNFGDSLEAADYGIGVFDLSTLGGSGLTRLGLGADALRYTDASGNEVERLGSIRFEDDARLAVARDLSLDSAQIDLAGHGVTLSADHVKLGNSDTEILSVPLASGGAGMLTVNAQAIDLQGSLAVRGADRVELLSTGDLRATGLYNSEATQQFGRFAVARDLVLQADQVYPSTLSHFEFESLAPDGTISVLPGGPSGPVLSAAGELSFKAAHIDVQGTLKAPLGRIDLHSVAPGGTVHLAPGSLVSVSAENQILPFGEVQNGKDWVYEIQPGIFRQVTAADLEKRVRLEADSVQVEAGAKIDVSGGGDAFAYEFVPGPGGSRDQLTASAQIEGGADAPTRFAILPWKNAGTTPFDPVYARGYDLSEGKAVYLEGMPGLPAGTYLLLPAHYALLPGARLIEALPDSGKLVPNLQSALADGTPVAAGYFKRADTDERAPGWSGFAVYTREQALKFSEFKEHYANSFFPASAAERDLPTPRVPADAGHLAIVARADLTLEGELAASHAAGQRGAEVDIVAPKLAITAPGDTRAGYVTLDAEVLNRLNAESLLLGGERTADETARTIAVDTTSEVLVGQDAALTAPEILLAARDKVKIESGASVVSSGETVNADAPIAIDGDGAFVAVSNHSVSYTRSGVTRTTGNLDVASGARIEAGGGIILDATRENLFEGQLSFSKPEAGLTLGASRISFGDAPQDTPGLVFGSGDLGVFGAARALDLKSYSSIDFYGTLVLGELDAAGEPLTRSLRLSSGGLRGLGSASDTVTLRAANLVLENPDALAAPASASGSGVLALETNRFVAGKGDKALSGFKTVSILARDEIAGEGVGKTEVSGDVVLTAPRVTGGVRADQTLAASGALTLEALQRPENAAPLPAAALGATWRFDGASVTHRGVIEVPAGLVSLRATTGDIDIDADARIDVSGRLVDYSQPDQGLVAKRYVDGGSVELEAQEGDVVVRDSARIDVSAGTGASGGSLSLAAAQGDVQLGNGTLAGGANAAIPEGTGGSFRYDARALSDFSTLNRQLNAAGFSEGRALRARTGDVQIPGDETVQAHDFTLTTDTGAITVAGLIDASGAKGGRIGLYGENGVTLQDGALLDAHATEADKRGGRVELAAGSGMLDLQAGSRIDVTPGGGGQPGKVLLRAARTDAGDGVNVTRLASQVDGAGSVVLEAVKTYSGIDTISNSGTGSTLAISTVDTDNADFMAHADAIRSALGQAGNATFHLRSGVEIRSSGDLTLATDWNLAAARDGGEPGVLTLRAAGDLLLDGSLSDGFSGVAPSAAQLGGDSWSYRLVAGAETGPDPLATRAGAGDVKLMAGRLVRTGTGDIDIAAGRNVEVGWDGTGDNQATAVIYTAGAPSAALPTSEFRLPSGANYPDLGGDLSIRAGQDVRGAITPQLVTAWLRRQGQLNPNGTLRVSGRDRPSWWVDFSKFQQNVGALGGGDVRVTAGRDIDNLSVSLPTTGRLPGANNTLPDESRLVVNGGGDLDVRAGGDLRSGVFLVGKGAATINVKGDIEAGRTVADTNPNQAFNLAPVHTLLALGDATAKITAGGNLDLESIANPTVMPQDVSGSSQMFFFSYGEKSGADLVSIGGDVRLYNNAETLNLAHPGLASQAEDQSTWVSYAPILDASAHQGSIGIERTMSLYPSAYGHLALLAQQDVIAEYKDGTEMKPSAISLSDVDPRLLPNPASPAKKFTDSKNQLFNEVDFNISRHASVPVHRVDATGVDGRADADASPFMVVAATGDIRQGDFFSATGFDIYAGRDVLDLSIEGQHVQLPIPGVEETSSVAAGRDIRYSTTRDAQGQLVNNRTTRVQLSGPGLLEVLAGRHIDLGNSKGILTSGDFKNPQLDSGGAAVRVLNGLAGGVDYAGFLGAYLDPAEGAGPYVDEMTQKVRTRLGDASLTPEQAYAWLAAQPANIQRGFVLDPLYGEIRQAGRGAASATTSGARDQSYQRGYDAIARLFPGDAQVGDLSMLFSKIQTEQGGGIDLLVPGGRVNAGQTAPSTTNASQKPELGILVMDYGDIRALVDGRGQGDTHVAGDFAVNESRVFTLRGGDILIWSSDGNIDAGRGAKSAVAAPPPEVLTDSNGNITLKVRSVSGSGIRAILTDASIDPKTVDVDLFAPKGEINAGDAGIGSAGNVTLAAVRVIGADNIDVGGVATGVPVSDGGASGLSGVSGLGDATKSAEEATKSLGDSAARSEAAAEAMKQSLAGFRPTFLSVEVLGFGNGPDECTDGDKACRKQNKNGS